MRNLALLFFLLSTRLVFGQNKTTNYIVEKYKTAATDSRIEVRPNKDTVLISSYTTQNSKNSTRNEFDIVYKGTPYFQNGWYKSDIYFTEGSKPIRGTIAYNLINQKVMYALSGTSEAKESNPNSFIINGNHFLKLNDYFSNAGTYYYQKIHIGKYQLFKAHLGIYTQLKSLDKSGYEPEPNEFEGEFTKFFKYYVAEGNQLVYLKNIKKYFKSKGLSSEKIEALLGNKKSDINNDTALIALFKYLEN